MSQHIGNRTITATGGSIKRVGNYRIHTFPSEIVTDGLVLNVDAGNFLSYEAGDTTAVNDLSGYGNHGTKHASDVGYNKTEYGSWNFTSSNSSIIDFDAVPQVTGSYTIDIWFNSSSVVSHKNICDMNWLVNQSNSGPRLEQNSSGNLVWVVGNIGDTSYQGVQVITSGMAANTVHHVVLSYNSETKEFRAYHNGSLETTNDKTFSENSVTFDNVALGAGFSNARYMDGKIYSFRIYNRALSNEEVAQNYDAQKIRYQSYSSTFTPTCAGDKGNVEVLCVAGGGGGGGGDVGSGGGAGGLVYNSSFSVDTNTGITVSVGGGGEGTSSSSSQGGDGSNTTFSTITAVGGGGGNGWGQTVQGNAGRSGGSGGGGRPGGAGTAGQGFAGGTDNSLGNNNYPQAGGGGAGGPGQDASRPDGYGSEIAGGGGPGLQYSISGESKYYAGGGGGGIESGQHNNRPFGRGGSGVGGDGGRQIGRKSAQHGLPNTGSGGGGDDPGRGGHGANGVVIVRYPAADYNVEVLVVGGGGAGGSGSLYAYSGGGGGAGGFIYRSSMTVSSGENVKISVGRGGTGTSSASYDPSPFGTTGNSGSNSRFGNLIAIGGGGGGGGLTYDGLPGGSGGGGGGRASDGGVGTTGQGFAGGSSSEHGDTTTYGAGGGGASSAGGNSSNTTTAPGGEGKANSITGSSVTYSVGGAGGNNGGTGSSTPVTNSGSGGQGGVGGGGDGVDGADGIVVVAYKGPQRGTGGTIDTTSRPGYTLHKFTSFGNDTFMP